MNHQDVPFEIVGTSGVLQLGGPGVSVHVGSVIVGTAAASAVVTLYKGVGATATKLLELDASANREAKLDCWVLGGAYFTVTGGAAKVTVTAGG